MPEVSCYKCNKKFNKPQCHINRVSKIFCSNECHNKHQKETKSLFKTCKICGDIFNVPPSNAKRYSTCFNPDCRQKTKQKELNSNWRGGVTNPRKSDLTTARYKNWRKSVFERDNYTCQFCGKRGGEMHADHIKPYAYFEELRYDVANGRTLCRSCHQTTYKEVFQWRKTLAESA